jgi:hypothetical protein
MPQSPDGVPGGHQFARCRHCSGRIERWSGGWWTHERSRSARCVPDSPLNAQLADPRPGTVGEAS